MTYQLPQGRKKNGSNLSFWVMQSCKWHKYRQQQWWRGWSTKAWLKKSSAAVWWWAWETT